MPWPPKQRTAIFLNVQRRKGTAAAEALMHEAGYGGKGVSTGGSVPKKRRYSKVAAGLMQR